jgi:hypothetical protein
MRIYPYSNRSSETYFVYIPLHISLEPFSKVGHLKGGRKITHIRSRMVEIRLTRSCALYTMSTHSAIGPLIARDGSC